jgi:rRNA maturation endonuclease Nob1
MFGNKEQVKVVQDIRDSKSKSEHISDYIESLKAIEDCMEPYKEQKRELKVEYLEKKWLSKEDISLSVKALRLLKENVDVGALIDLYDVLKAKQDKP